MNSVYRSHEQRQFADRVSGHLNASGAPLLLEGAAGLGKTRAYLAPLLDTRMPVAISVPTRALATQLLESSDMAALRTTQSVAVFTPRRNFESAGAYEAHKQACLEANVLICTHQAAVVDTLSGGAMLNLGSRHAVLFDEADQLPDAAALRFDCSIDAHVFKALGIRPGPNHRRTAEAVSTALRSPRGLAMAAEFIGDSAEIIAACHGILSALDEPAWYQSVGLAEDGSLKLTHLLPARALKGLFAHRRLIFASATLTVGGTFDDFKRALGLNDVSPWSTVIEPTKHGTMDVVSEEWDKDAPDHLEKVAEHVTGLSRGTEKVLVITTSHDDALTLGSMIPGAVVRSADDATGQLESSGQAAARMEAAGGTVLVAAAAWAGLDTATTWRHVVMPKAPYGSPQVLDGHEVSRYVDSRNTAVRRFRQGLARGLRRPDAVCTLHLLDARFARPEFVKALPQRFAAAYVARFSIRELRTRQAAFRKLIVERYRGRCAISGCEELVALEAAHIGDPGHWRYNHDDGILLRSDLHKLYDAGLLSINDGVVSILSSDPYFKQYDGAKVTLA